MLSCISIKQKAELYELIGACVSYITDSLRKGLESAVPGSLLYYVIPIDGVVSYCLSLSHLRRLFDTRPISVS